MVIYLLMNALDFILNLVINLMPIFSLPISLTSGLAKAIEIVVSFNYYLPISDVFIVIGFCIGFAVQFKIIKIILNKVGIDLSI